MWHKSKTYTVKNIKNSNYDKTLITKLWQNSKTQIVTKLKTQIVTKLKKMICVKTQFIKLL